MSTLETESLLFEELNLHVPSLDEVQRVLAEKLPNNFAHVSAEVVQCPNLQDEPYRLAAPGLGGSPILIEAGGPAFLLPKVDLTKLYDLKTIIPKCIPNTKHGIFAIGPGAGPYPVTNCNCEGIYNFKIDKDGTFWGQSYVSKVDGPKENCLAIALEPSETRCALLLNLFACQGTTGNVLKVVCKKRTGPLNYIESIRLALTEHFGDKAVGLGGMFILKKGAAKQHVMRDFTKTPITSEEELNQWLKFYEMPAPLNTVGTLVTQETELDLRLQHFHNFSSSHWAGHYHYDVTPDIVEYEGYFNIAEKVVRVDRPRGAHKLGRD